MISIEEEKTIKAHLHAYMKGEGKAFRVLHDCNKLDMVLDLLYARGNMSSFLVFPTYALFVKLS